MKKKLVAVLLTVAMGIGIAACGSSDKGGAAAPSGKDNAPASQTEAETQEETGTEAVPEGTLVVADDPADWPVVKMEVISRSDTQEREADVEAALNGVCQVKCVSFFIFYQRLYTAADFCVKYHFRSIPETVVKRTVE